MRARHMIPFGWMRQYEDLRDNYDLLPFWYGADWVDVPLEEGSYFETSVNISNPFWWYQLGIGNVNLYYEEQPPAVEQTLIPGLELRISRNNNVITGGFVPAALLIGGFAQCGLGPGLVFEKGDTILVEGRRPIPPEDPNVEGEKLSFVLHGCELCKPGAATYGQHNWRNLTLAEIDKIAPLRPWYYHDRVLISTEAGATSVDPIELRVRDRDFYLDTLYAYEYPTASGQTFNQYSPAPPAIEMSDDAGLWHNREIVGGLSTQGVLGVPPYLIYPLRIPRLIPKNRDVYFRLGGRFWAATEEPEERWCGVVMSGYEVWGDRRGDQGDPGPELALPYHLRHGAR